MIDDIMNIDHNEEMIMKNLESEIIQSELSMNQENQQEEGEQFNQYNSGFDSA